MADYHGDLDDKPRFSPTVHPKRPLCACTSYSCNKLFLFLLTLLYVVVGAGLFVVGVWVQFQLKDYEAVNSDLTIPVLTLISVGGVITIISLIGMAGTLRENNCMLVFYLLVTFVAFLAQVSIGVLAFIHRQKIPHYKNEDFHFLVRDYHDNTAYRSAVDNVQISFRCCGFGSYDDYDKNRVYNCTHSELPQRCGVPWSCCKPSQSQDKGFQVNCGYGVRGSITVPARLIYTAGCTDLFLSWLSWNLDFVGIVGLGSSIPQVVSMLLAYFFIRQIREMKMWYRVGM